ncbi:hypothetical protein CHELA40_15273 [Chelatococcus asaccharovorans]|nr:hypothetical protein CHELA17_60345 [Chelatococcus asaccharovorans]CAH1682021.1 hypothetical protein CHELA40_15273 [Chelatococcus asaccharovorans]
MMPGDLREMTNRIGNHQRALPAVGGKTPSEFPIHQAPARQVPREALFDLLRRQRLDHDCSHSRSPCDSTRSRRRSRGTPAAELASSGPGHVLQRPLRASGPNGKRSPGSRSADGAYATPIGEAILSVLWDDSNVQFRQMGPARANPSVAALLRIEVDEQIH